MNDLTPTNEQPSELMEQPAESGLAFVMPDQFPDLDNADLGMRLEKQYYAGFKNAGDRVRAIFNGMDRMTTKKNNVYKVVSAICFQTKDGVYLHGGASLVEQFRSIPPGTPVQITYLGSEKTGNNNDVNKFEVRLLKVSVKAVRVENTPAQSAPVKKAEEPILSEPGNPPPPDGLVFTNTELANAFWDKARNQLGLTRDEGLVHLASFGNDFKKGLEAL